MNPMRQPVQQWWTLHIPWKMQTVMIQGFRAPDTHYCRNIKIICRWMRSIVLNNADDGHPFMCRKKKLPTWERIENELNYCSFHFATHFLYALEIIGYKHPNAEVRSIAFNYYRCIVEDMSHLIIESENKLDIRLADVEEVPCLSDVLPDHAPAPKICPRPDKYIRQ